MSSTRKTSGPAKPAPAARAKAVHQAEQVKQTKSISAYWYVLLPLILTALTHANGIQNGFVNFDDELYILLNTRITALTSASVQTFFTTYLGGNYHPLTELSNAIDYAIAGKHDATTYHLFNYLYHLVNTVLVFLFIKKLSKGNLPVAAAVACLFGIHPMHVESVAWISERKDVLYSLFFLLSLNMYLSFKENGRNLYWLLSLLFFVLSCLSKSMAVTLPLVLLLLDYYLSDDRLAWKAVMNKMPFFVVSLVFGIVALKSQQAQGYIADYHFSILQKFFIACYSVSFYILKLIVPVNLSCLHPLPVKGLNMWYYLSVLVLPAVYWLVLKAGQYRKLLVFGLLFFLSTLVLVLQFINIGAAVVSERYTYIPYLGLFFIIAIFFSDIAEGRIKSLEGMKGMVKPFFAIVLLVFAWLSYQRNTVWKDGESLWRDCTAQYPETADYAWYGLGNILKEKYDRPDAQMNGQPKPSKEEILQAYDNAIRINPDFPNYYLNGSSARSAFGDKAGAMKQLDKAIQLDPRNASCFYNRGVIETELNQHEASVRDYSKAIELNPGYWQAWFNRAITYKNLNKPELAIIDYQKVMVLNPGYVFTYNNLGNIYFNLGRFDDAIRQYNTALRYDAKQSNTYKNRGAAKLALQRKAEACADFEISMKMGDPEGKDAFMHVCQQGN